MREAHVNGLSPEDDSHGRLRWMLPLLLAGTGPQRCADGGAGRTVQTTGTVQSVSRGLIEILDAEGERREFKIQDKDRPGLALTGIEGLLRFPAEVKITGTQSTAALTRGTPVRFSGRVNRLGRTEGSISELVLLGDDDLTLGIEVVEQAAAPGDFSECTIRAEVYSFRDDRLVVTVPASDFVRNPRLAFRVDKQAVVRVESDDYRLASRGDRIVRLVAARFSTGDLAVQQLEIELSGDSSAAGPVDEIAAKYRQLSDEPRPPRDLRSANFLLRTDISDRSARILLDKLETMIALVSQYYGRPPNGLIECYVVRDLNNWPPGTIPPNAVAKIQGTGGRHPVGLAGKPDALGRLLVRQSRRGTARSHSRLLRPDVRRHGSDLVRRGDGRVGPVLEEGPVGGRYQSGGDPTI
jgi:hypothetical protein